MVKFRFEEDKFKQTLFLTNIKLYIKTTSECIRMRLNSMLTVRRWNAASQFKTDFKRLNYWNETDNVYSELSSNRVVYVWLYQIDKYDRYA